MPLEPIRLRHLVVNAWIMALGLALPVAFHAAGLGSKFTPMLLPLLLNGFLSPWSWAAFTAGLTPLVSALVTGMPPIYPPVALIMSVEASVLAVTACLLDRATRGKVWLATVVAVASGRTTSLALTWLVAGLFELPRQVSVGASLLGGLPGIALQLTVVPVAAQTIRRRPSLLFRDVR
ncbi:MAG: hypothetical protein RMI94_10915 [Bryobacterales bacterium]|nr:hypothetical protein [Bryobacteraceae bacterium]MDW8131051.1 hypothetical protein [Bryobacterales bacterium]